MVGLCYVFVTFFLAPLSLFQPRTVSEVQKRVTRLLTREERKRKRLEELGLDYQFYGYRGLCNTTATAKTATHIVFTDEGTEEEEEEEIEMGVEGTESE